MTTDDPHQLEPDHLPTPFSADEIRIGCPPGHTLRYLHERSGQPPSIRVSRYVSGDAQACLQETWQESSDGAPLGAPEHTESTWLQLQQHASFPRATTRRDEETIDLPAGRYTCLRYTRTDDRGTWRFWFARELPGAPVRFEQQVGDDVVFRASLLESSRDATTKGA